MKEKNQTSGKPAQTAPAKTATPAVSNPSEKLANLLRKEGMLAARAKKAQDELRTIRKDIQALWEVRNEQAADLLDEILEG